MNPLGRERRNAPRTRVHALLAYGHRLDHRIFSILGIGSALDLSASGLRFLCYEAIAAGSTLELQLSLDGGTAHVEQARVVRSSSRRDGAYEVAVRFERILPAAWHRIGTWVEGRQPDRPLAG